MVYNSKDYWEKHLSNGFSLSKVGHIGFNLYYNKWLYKAKIRTLKRMLSSYHIVIQNKAICDIVCGTGFFVGLYEKMGAKEIVDREVLKLRNMLNLETRKFMKKY